jgi:ketosteroid isomerase-like protein
MRGWVWVVVVMAVAPAFARQGQDAALASLVEAERAFASMSVRTSQREAFLATFAEDGVSFAPAPVNTRESLSAGPPGEQKFTLDWEPVTGDVAASGDLGYSTGPYTVSQGPDAGSTKITGQGWFFSIWKRAAGGPWRVAADFGVSTPPVGVLRPRPFQRAASRAVPAASPAKGGGGNGELLDAERAFADQASRDGSPAAYRARATADVRVYRQGSAPLVGPEEAEPRLPPRGARVTWEPGFAAVSSAGDLGYAYGAYTVRASITATPTLGYYLHVWKRMPPGWRLAADVTNQSGPASR